ncbi:MAG: DNA-binding response regulator [Actinobacteria bacterium HGW-Actinobacteria-1]|jgi:two-component system alkaline phosphatase synthesis response regulator PhoP|nr:MAG: DNA-binding response regulator [Actinobacteria bacterium HGW-Actinobacteria-1]
MPRALVVDDEANIRELVSVYLSASGFVVEQAGDGLEGLRLAESGEFDIVILDIMLPGMDGSAVCRRLRETSSIPVIMLTARDTDLDKVAMLESGADDYLTKPFSPPELVARARAVLRRVSAPTQPSRTMSIGGLSLDPATREISVDGVPVELTAKEFDVLEVMMRDAGVVFSRERLLESAWGFSDYVDARGIDVHIKHIREKIGDDAGSPRFVETVRGVGYRVRRDAQ